MILCLAYQQASGETYYYNADAGEAQWQVPPSAYSSSLVWRVLPHAGIRYEYAGCTLAMPLCAGEEQTLGAHIATSETHNLHAFAGHISEDTSRRHFEARARDSLTPL